MTDERPARRLDAVRLRVASLERSLAFYADRFGMEVSFRDGPVARIGFPGATRSGQASLELTELPVERTPDRHDVYWKIGLTVPDVDLARERLNAHGLSVSPPAQFLDVGYLCHLNDPDGYEIELLQHDFEADHEPIAPGDDPLGAPATLGQITLRIDDADRTLDFYLGLGMRLLSRQVIHPHEFTLYFLAFTQDQTPFPDVDAVENRSWLWRRPYTTLELQQRWHGPPPRPSEDAGFDGLVLAEEKRTTSESIRDPEGTRLDLRPGGSFPPAPRHPFEP